VEIQIDGNVYRIGKLSAFAQLHVSRKIAPVLPKLLPAMMASMSLVARKDEEMPDLNDLADAFGPVAQALAEMPDKDAEYVYNACLSVVQIQQGSASVNIWNPDAQCSQFDFIDLGVMTRLVGHTVWGSLSGFINGFLAKLPAA
jgi:hypothetical protein